MDTQREDKLYLYTKKTFQITVECMLREEDRVSYRGVDRGGFYPLPLGFALP